VCCLEPQSKLGEERERQRSLIPLAGAHPLSGSVFRRSKLFCVHDSDAQSISH
jgi:hypothetical protein